jgi:uncharacterized protein YfaS (alpha-2-macroglobulin family)
VTKLPLYVASLLLLFIAALPSAATQPEVELFSPQGTVKDIRQAAVRFSVPMVRIGDPRLADPFTINCPASGGGRWADGRNWVYDFDADLPGGVRCRFALRADLLSLDDDPIGGERLFEFDTGGPAIRASLPYEGAVDIDEAQIFILALDAPATAASVAKHAQCRIAGHADLVDVDVLDGEAREEILGLRRQLGYGYWRILWKDGRSTVERVEDKELAAAEALITVLQCRQRIPPETEMEIIWGAGIAAESGIATQDEQRLSFKTRAEFSASFSCQRANPQAQCLPFGPLTIDFSAPVPAQQALAARLIAVDGNGYAPESPDTPETGTIDYLSFAGPFPQNTRFTVTLPEDLRDDAGRPLANAGRFPLEVATDGYPPLAKFSAEFGILELRTGGVLPVTIRNLEADLGARRINLPTAKIAGQQLRISEDDAVIAGWLRRVEQAMRRRGEWMQGEDGEYQWIEQTGDSSVFSAGDQTETFAIPRSEAPQSFEVVGIPLEQPGFYVVELASPLLGAALLGEGQTRFVATSALVTNLAVHLKWGRESSRVWVTRLDDATPVADALVTVIGFCDGAQLWQGKTDGEGLARIDAVLPEPHSQGDCSEWHPQPLFVSARIDDDLAFTVSGWQDGIEPSDFGLPAGRPWQALVAHTVLDRSLFRAGETVSMKHYLRERAMAGLVVPADVNKRGELTVRHRGSNQSYRFDVDFGSGGIAENQWSIPNNAKLGDYDIQLTLGDRVIHSGSLRVEQYRVPTMQASIQAPAAPLVAASEATLDLYVGYLAGGGVGGAPVKLRTLVERYSAAVPGFEDYSFGGEDVKEGIEQSTGYDYFAGRGQSTAAVTTAARILPLALDEAGAARATVPDLPAITAPHQLVAELEYADANGELLSVARRLPLWPAAVRVGVRTEGWAAVEDQLRFRVVAVDLHSNPVAGQRVSVDLFKRQVFSYRKRLIGGFYAYENTTKIERIGEICAGDTDAQGLLLCDIEPGVSGSVILRARAEDTEHRLSLATRNVWIAGADDWWFGGGAGDRIDVLPEAQTYESGDVARFQVRMPFRSAIALVTVEREGVLDAFVTKLDGRESVIDVPIKPGYAPNVYVSVLAIRGRVGAVESWLADQARRFDLPWRPDGAEPTALIDLSKPAFRLGIAAVDVGWAPHRLEVEVKPGADTYRVRETAKLRVAVRRADGGKLPADAEFALAAVDEGLLELSPNRSWKLLDAMMGERGLEVRTATAQMQVVGKRHYGRKAVPHGGGGGREPARELFDTLLFWRGRVALDASGQAELEVPLNDALTSFRLVAIASAGSGFFGTGSANIKTRQDLMLFAGLPPVVREGDRFIATFTVRNASDRQLRADANALMYEGGNAPALSLATQHIELAPGQAQSLTWEVTTPFRSEVLSWDVHVAEHAGVESDRLVVKQKVLPAWPVRVQQATLMQVDAAPEVLAAQRPAGALADRGGISVQLSRSLAGNLAGVRDYMAAYPYTCLEQRVSQAVALRDEDRWSAVMDLLPSYLDDDGLLKYFPSNWLDGSDTLTAYVLAISHQSGWPIPADQLTRLQEGLRAFVEARVSRDSPLPTADLAIRKLAAIEALSRYGRASGADLTSVSIEPNLWPTSALIDWLLILQRLEDVPQRAFRYQEAQRLLRARLNFQGTTMGFSTERTDALWWLMISGDVNALRALLALLDEPLWREDLPRMARGALGRQSLGRWSTTTANAWGVLAMERFGAEFEADAVSGRTELSFADNVQDWNWLDTESPHEALFAWPADGAGTLELTHAGSGQPWALVETRAALPLREPLSSGYIINRTLTAVDRKDERAWSVGDVVRVTLDIDAQADMTWVVVDDPVPAGASILGTGLGRDSQLLTRGEQRQGWAWPAYEERRFDAFRAYYQMVPKGSFKIEYTLRLNNAGHFVLPATRVEALYAPEMFAELPNEILVVRP